MVRKQQKKDDYEQKIIFDSTIRSGKNINHIKIQISDFKAVFKT
jgi:hypothetical protein